MDAEYSSGWFSWETEMRLDEVKAELDRRENGALSRTVGLNHRAS
jgi:hypothetical protein